ncbi:MAG: hypothetical protein CMO80_12775 [Verrucomicrobiales bacterium]|nr:hypothetical protein [Verrucomicrobiales bacterium]
MAIMRRRMSELDEQADQPSTSQDRWQLVVWIIALAVLAFFAFSGTDQREPDVELPVNTVRGEQIAQSVCVTCHVPPDPSEADRYEWAMELLEEKRTWLSIEFFDFRRHPGGEAVAKAQIFPRTRAVSDSDWRAVCEHYLAHSQVRMHAEREELSETKQFEPTVLPYPAPARITLVRFDPAGVLYLGNTSSNVLHVVSPTGRILATPPIASPPVDLTVDAEGMFITCIGSMAETDIPDGELVFIEKPKAGGSRVSSLLKNLMRPVHTSMADLNSDGRQDLVISERGALLGRFAVYQNKGSNQFEPLPLLKHAGAVQSAVADFNGDGAADIAIAVSHAKEAIYVFDNVDGDFSKRTVVEKSPLWDFSCLVAADLNGDGHPDLIAGNGAAEDPTQFARQNRAYHGIRAYLNDGSGKFAEKHLLSLAGARKIVAHDFDRDGDADIAAIADDEIHPFVYLRNKGEQGFQAGALHQSVGGRWFDLDLGDLDGDGDTDIILGAYNVAQNASARIKGRWESGETKLLVLKNTSR